MPEAPPYATGPLAPDTDADNVAQRGIVLCGERVTCYLLAYVTEQQPAEFVRSLEIAVDVATQNNSDPHVDSSSSSSSTLPR